MIVRTSKGVITVTDIINGDFYKRRYVGDYDHGQAIKLFLEEFKQEYKKEKEFY